MRVVRPADISFVPPDPNSGGYGSGSGGGGGFDAGGPPMCDESRASVLAGVLVPSAGDESAVPLIGDFAADGMDGGRADDQERRRLVGDRAGAVERQGHIQVPRREDGHDEAYVPDPANPPKSNDGFGGKNSVLTTGTCTTWTCVSRHQLPGRRGRRLRLARRGHLLRVHRSLQQQRPHQRTRRTAIARLGAANCRGGDWQGVIDKINAGLLPDARRQHAVDLAADGLIESVGIAPTTVHYFNRLPRLLAARPDQDGGAFRE